MLQDGEWVTVNSSTSGNDDGSSAEEALAQAMTMLQQMKDGVIDVAAEPAPAPPQGFKPIPISGKKKKAKRRRRRREVRLIPLELDPFDPADPADDDSEETSAEATGAARGRSEP